MHRSRNSAVYKLDERYHTNDLEDALTRNLVDGAHAEQPFDGMPIQDILYSASPAMRSMAYKFGFSLGQNIHLISDGRNVLPEVLEKAGFGKVIYYPFEDKVVITSTRSKSRGSMRDNIHVCDSGIIAGYLSAATGQEITARETHCVYGDSEFCQFIATPSAAQQGEESHRHGLDAMADALSSSVEGGGAAMHESYYLLSTVPLMKEPMLQEASKLLYLAGKRMAESTDAADGKKAIERMAKRLGVMDVRVRTDAKGTPKSINLEYSQSASTKPFIELSTSLIAGFTNSLYGSSVEMSRRLGRHANYIIGLTLRN